MTHVFVTALFCVVASGLHAQSDSLQPALQELKTSIERHQWLQILDRADAQHRETQTMEMQMAHAQYVAELLGLNYVDNNLRGNFTSPSGTKGLRRLLQSVVPESLETPAPVGPISEADLNQIRRVEWQSEVSSGVPGWRTVRGIATLRSGRTVRIEADLVKRAGVWKLTGAVG